MKIFIAKLSLDTDEDRLKSVFENHGKVISAKIALDKSTGRSKGFGLVEMLDKNEALAAITAMNKFKLDGHQIEVKAALGPHGGGKGLFD